MRQTKITAFIEMLKDDEPTELDLLELIELCENTNVRRIDVEATTELLLKVSKAIDEKVIFDLTSKLVSSFPFAPKLIVETTFYGDLHPAIYKVDFSYYIQKFFEKYFNDQVLVKRHDGIFCETLDLLIVNEINHIIDPRNGMHDEILCHVNYALDCLLNATTFNLRRGLPVDRLLKLCETKIFNGLSDTHLKIRRNWFIDRQKLVSSLLSVDQQQIDKPTTTKPKLMLGLVIWGHAIEQAEQSCIPTFFAKKNWTVLSNVFDTTLHVITLTAHAAKLELHNALNLPKNVDVQYHYMSSDIVQQSASMEGFNYHLSSMGHNILVKLSINLNSSLVLLTPDAVYSQNVSNEICTSFNKNKMLFCQCPRTICPANSSGRNFEDQEMSEALKKRLHSSNFAYSNLKNTVSGLPGIFVSAERKRYIVQTFHPHPLLIPHDFLIKRNMHWFESIDGDFAAHLYIAAGGTTDNFENLVELHRELDKPVMIDLTHQQQHNDSNETEIDQALSQEEVKNFTRRLGLLHRLAFDRPGIISDALEEEAETTGNTNLQTLREFVNGNANADSWPSVTDIPAENNIASVEDESVGSNAQIKKTVVMCAFVWGDEYIDNFLTVCLPTLLSSIKVAHTKFKNEICCRLVIGVPSSQFDKLNRIQKKLDTYTPAKTEFVELESLSVQNELETKYQRLINLQVSSLQKYKSADYMCFVYSDFVWSLNTVSALYAQIKAGATAVFQFIPQVNKDKFLIEFISEVKANRRQNSLNDFGIRISEDRLVGLVRRNLHYLVTSSIHNRQTFNPVGPYYFLSDDQNNLVVRAFHLHPTIFKIPERVVAVDSSFDEKFITSNFSIADCQVITSSDQACICSLERETLPRGKGAKEKLGYHQNWQAWFIDWFLTKADPQHWFLFQHEIMFGRYQNNALLLEHRKKSSDWLNGLLFQLAMLQSNHSDGTQNEGKATNQSTSFLARCFFKVCVLFEPIFSASLRSVVLENMPVSLRAKLTSYKGKRNG